MAAAGLVAGGLGAYLTVTEERPGFGIVLVAWALMVPLYLWTSWRMSVDART
jgi:hypothetical protein